jgi:hypothetical protein
MRATERRANDARTQTMKPYPRTLDGAKVTVMGLGQFGGGLGVTRWLVERGARVLLTDRDPAEKLTKPLAELEAHVASGAVALRLGAHEEQDFADADLVVANPAVPLPWDNRFLRAATAAGTPVTTEIRLAIDGLDRERTLGVTGSAGKSSTSSMIALVLAGDGRTARLGGNIGGSLLGSPGEPGEWTVLELSSAMLWWLSEGAAMAGLPAWAPRVTSVLARGAVTLTRPGQVVTASYQSAAAGKKAGPFAPLWQLAQNCVSTGRTVTSNCDRRAGPTVSASAISASGFAVRGENAAWSSEQPTVASASASAQVAERADEVGSRGIDGQPSK